MHFEDLTQLLPYVSRVLFYTSGVFFSVELAFAANPTVLEFMAFQPVHEFLTLGRSVLLDEPGFIAPPEFWLYASVWSFTVIVLGSIFFWAAEERYGRVD